MFGLAGVIGARLASQDIKIGAFELSEADHGPSSERERVASSKLRSAECREQALAQTGLAGKHISSFFRRLYDLAKGGL